MNKKAIIGSILSTLMYTIMFFSIVVILIIFINSSKQENQSRVVADFRFDNDLFYINRLFINEEGKIEIHYVGEKTPFILEDDENEFSINVDEKNIEYKISKIPIQYYNNPIKLKLYNYQTDDIIEYYVYKQII